MTEQLEKLRKELDAIDTELLQVLAKRMEIVTEIGKIKKINYMKPLDQKRWEEVLKTRTEQGQRLGLTRAFILKIWDTIHKESLKKEEAV